MRGRALSLALDSLVRPNSVRCRDIDIQIYRRGSPHATAALALGSLPIPVYRCPNVLACQRSNYVSLPERLTPLKKKKPARRGLAGHGGDSEATLSEGESPARYGDALDRRGLVERRCELPRMCYRLPTLHLFRRMSASRKQLAKRPRLK